MVIHAEQRWSTVVNGGYPPVNAYKKLWQDSPFSMGKSTISMVMFNSYGELPEGKSH